MTSNLEHTTPLLEHSRLLHDLLAIIHCDGGHYTAAVGVEKSVVDAMIVRTSLVNKVNEQQEKIAQLDTMARMNSEYARAYELEMNQYKQQLSTTETRIKVLVRTIPYPSLTSGNLKSIAFHLESIGKSGLTAEAEARCLRHVAEQLDAFAKQALNLPTTQPSQEK